MDPIIELRNISKSFTFWQDRPTSIKRILADILTGKISLGKRNQIEILNDLSFSIHAGEFVGIMGRNGAGKSTILKLLAGIYQPTSGTVSIRGNVAPLLELGAGFSEDLSGYENIFLNAAILGYGKKRTTESIDSIIEFSELGDKIHMPVRNFSSGMLVRLGFSIAVHLDSQILLFDEILAVGDVAFQEKCLTKIRELHSKGRAIVLITHSPEQVIDYCGRCIVIDNQTKVFDGSPTEGAECYQKICQSPPTNETVHHQT